MAVDSAAGVHVAYLGGDECRYAKKVGRTWTLQVIDTVSPGKAGATSIALDSAGNPNVSYVHNSGDDPDNPESGWFHVSNSEARGVKYAQWNGTEWLIEALGLLGSDTDIAVDPEGTPYISFKTDEGGAGYEQIVCARKTGGTWAFDYFDPTTQVGGDTRLAVSANGHVHVVYRDWANGYLKYGSWNTTTWQVETVATDAGQQEGLDIAVDSLNRPHIAYNALWGQDDMALKYAYRESGTWVTETIDWGGNPGIAVDSWGLPHIGRGNCRDAEEYVPKPWPVNDCEILKYSVRTTFPCGCLNVGNDASLPISCAEYQGTKYRFTLDLYSNPDLPSGLYWKMDNSTLGTTSETSCINVGSDASLPISCAEYLGTKYQFTLDLYSNPDIPSGLYWKMDSSTLKVK